MQIGTTFRRHFAVLLIFVGITGVQMVSITTEKVYYAGHLYDVSYLRFPASPLVGRYQ
jgi:hypothetical protein